VRLERFLLVIFSGKPGLASVTIFPFWVLSELRMMEVVVTTGAIRCAKLQLNRHHQQTNTFLQVECPSCHPTSSVKALKEKEMPGNLPVIA